MLVPALVVLGFLSLLWSQRQLSLHPEASFYLLQSRAFELTIGVLLARLNWKPGLPAAQLLSSIGAALLIVGHVFCTATGHGFPGLAALVPCLGAALIIWSGQAGTVLSRILGIPPLVYVGKISYPLYLGTLAADRFRQDRISGSIGVVICAVCHRVLRLWRPRRSIMLVEKPIRTGRFTLAKASFLGTAASVSMVGDCRGALGERLRRSDRGPRAQQHVNFEHPNLKELFLQGRCFLDPEQDVFEL